MGRWYNPRDGGVAVFFSPNFPLFSLRVGQKEGRDIRPVTKGWGEGLVCTCLDVKSVYFFCFLNNSILQSGMVEHLRLLQNCQQIENHYFQLIHKILKNSSVRFEYTAI